MRGPAVAPRTSPSLSTADQQGGPAAAASLAHPLPLSPADPKQLLRVMDAFWSGLKEGKPAAAPQVVRRLRGQRLDAPPEVDVAVAGGTLGILLATALQVSGVCAVCACRRHAWLALWAHGA